MDILYKSNIRYIESELKEERKDVSVNFKNFSSIINLIQNSGCLSLKSLSSHSSPKTCMPILCLIFPIYILSPPILHLHNCHIYLLVSVNYHYYQILQKLMQQIDIYRYLSLLHLHHHIIHLQDLLYHLQTFLFFHYL